MSDPIEYEDRPRWGLISLSVLVGIALLGAMGAVWFVSNPNFTPPLGPLGSPVEAPPQPPPKPVKSADGHMVSNPDWLRRPTSDDFARYYPELAMQRQMAGRVVLSCMVARTGQLVDCAVASESPPGWGFGSAAVRMAGGFRMYPKTVDGQPVDSGQVRIPILFSPSN